MTHINTLALAQGLRDEAGFDQKQAEGAARVLARTLGNDVATTGFVGSTVKESELRLTAKLEEVKADILKWLFGSVVALVGLLIAAIKLIP